jgi:hypothetical protein
MNRFEDEQRRGPRPLYPIVTAAGFSLGTFLLGFGAVERQTVTVLEGCVSCKGANASIAQVPLPDDIRLAAKIERAYASPGPTAGEALRGTRLPTAGAMRAFD